jgi:hypothetical protein
MSKFGRKFTCYSCSSKFYDLNKPNPKCPKCGADPEDDPNKGIPVAAAPEPTEEFSDEVEEEAADEDADEEGEDDMLDEGEEEF